MRRRHASVTLAARAPNRAVPTRTIVAPSAMAISKSSLMPIDSVSTCGWCAAQACRTVRACAAKGGAARVRRPDAARESPSGRAARSRGLRGDRRRPARSTSSGRQPCLLASSSMLTWISTFSGARSQAAVRARARHQLDRGRRSAPSRSSAAASAALFDCRWPIRCHSSVPSDRRQRGLLGRGFLHVVLAEGALARRRPAPRRPSRRLGLADRQQPRLWPSGRAALRYLSVAGCRAGRA